MEKMIARLLLIFAKIAYVRKWKYPLEYVIVDKDFILNHDPQENTNFWNNFILLETNH